MPQANRDKDSLYPPGKLSLWFLATSGALVLGLVWMLAGDFDRPWKGVQRAFYERQAGILSIQRDLLEADLRASDEKAKELKDLGERIAAAERALEAPAQAEEIARLEAQRAEQKARRDEADNRIKAVKGAYSERRYAFEMARKNGETEKAGKILERLNELGSEQDLWERKGQAEHVEQDRVEARLEAIRAPLKALVKRRDDLLEDVSKTTTAMVDSRDRTERDQWRNLPVVDFLTPSIKIEKVVLQSIHDDFNFATSPKVDMCMTCHAGIAKEAFTEPKVRTLLTGYLRTRFGEKAWSKLEDKPGWAKATAPGTLKAWLSGSPSLLGPIPGEKADETVFTQEQVEAAIAGGEADPKARAILLGKFRDRVLGGKSLAEGCRDILAPFAIRPVEWAHPHLEMMVGPSSPHPMDKMGCTVCHAGVGRRLEFVRATHTPNDEEQEKAWKKAFGWTEPELVDFPMLPMRYVEGQCLKCHQPTLQYRPIPEPLVRTTTKKYADGTTDVVRATAPSPVDGTASEAEDRWHPDRLEHGTRIMRESGCQGCHLIRDFAPSTGFPRPTSPDRGFDFSTPAPGSTTAAGLPKVGPDLTHVKDKTTREWTLRWLESPNAFKIDTRMPSFYRHRLHDDAYRPLLGADGKPQDVPIVVNPDARDLAQIDVETLALTAYLFDGQTGTRAAGYAEPPKGDPENGRKIFYSSANCYACHLGPDDAKEGSPLPDGTRNRFARREDLPPGPRLVSLGSKLNAKWLFAWLKEPRHYNSVTRMPNNRLRDETAADGKTVVRSSDQLYADLVAYLLESKDKAFDERPVPDPTKGVRWSEEHNRLLKDMWGEWYGKKNDDGTLRSTEAGEAVAAERLGTRMADMLVDVGRGLVRFRGCFGCHNVEGFETAQPIGKELSAEGSQDLHKFDFALLKPPEVEHSRWGWIHQKLAEPRIWDKGKFKPRWSDKLRMPKFNFREVDRTAVTAVVLGLVREPIKQGDKDHPGLYHPTPDMAKVAAGRAVIDRYSCGQCHTIENRRGVITAEQLERGMELWMLPPNLYGEGNRVKAEWLFRFLKEPFDVRPSTVQRMPKFRLSDEEVAALVDYFEAVAGRKDRQATDPEDHPLDATPYAAPVTIHVKTKDAAGADVDTELVVHDEVEEAKALFTTFNCVKCHLPKGTPGADPNEGASAPPFTLAGARLQRAWMEDLLVNPQYQIQNTKMVAFWPPKSKRGKVLPAPDSLSMTYPQFLCSARAMKDPKNDDVAHAQMKALVRYLLWHYQAPGAVSSTPPGTPPEPTGK